MLPSVGIEPGPLINSDSKSNLTFACKTETLGSLYNHALLILLKSLKSKYQVVKEQKFKDLLSSTCPVSVESMVLNLESEVRRGPGSIPTGGNILSLDFYHVVKPLMSILPSSFAKNASVVIANVRKVQKAHDQGSILNIWFWNKPCCLISTKIGKPQVLKFVIQF